MFPKLYKLNNGKLYEWEIKVEEKSPEEIIVHTYYGFVGGAIQDKPKSIRKGKASRSLLEQATLEAKSKWKDKNEKEAYVTDMEQAQAQAQAQDTANIRPMLAQTFHPDKFGFGNTKLYVQRKYDGLRCLAFLPTGATEVRLESRKGIAFAFFDNIKQELLPILEINQELYLDGELYTNELPFETLSGLIRKKTLTSLDRVEMNKIKYHIYDVFDPKRPDWTYEYRMEFLENLFAGRRMERIHLVQTEVINSLPQIRAKHASYVNEEFEGIILRWPHSVYEIGKRSKGLQKYKEFMEEEFRIVGFHEGEASETGCIIWECSNSSGATFSVRPRGTQAYRRELFSKGEEFIGKFLTIIFQEYSTDGIPRFPVGKGVREDI